ncbi:MAG: hypothetical protein HYZ75_00840 [Elusimicrobia bacterium]|nr:hypothetical protein [Elusimicrobiota bacterium]
MTRLQARGRRRRKDAARRGVWRQPALVGLVVLNPRPVSRPKNETVTTVRKYFDKAGRLVRMLISQRSHG